MNESTEFKNQDKSLRKKMIINAAIKVFHQKGYRSATLDDVANELGLTRPALYHYVSSKENLLSLIYLKALERFFAIIYEITGMDLSPPEKLRVFVRRHLHNIVIENLAMFTVFFSEENQLPEEDFQKIRTEKRKFTRVVEKIIEEGIAQGYFREVNVRLQANAIIGMCNWLFRWYKPGKSSFTPDEIAAQFIDLLENGLCRPNGSHVKSVETEKQPIEKVRRQQKQQILKQLKTNSDKIADLIEALESLQ
ncbi:MAG: TetR family transcriptional regulator [Desulfobacterales bacterium]|nr:MAG: TetR family transcriptional regulator [Desulfobacterales bacterium]